MEHSENRDVVDRLRTPDVGFLLFALGLLTGVIVDAFYLTATGRSFLIQGQSMEYKDYISIILTATTVILAVLAVFIGALTVWGYSQFSIMIQNSSRDHIKDLLSKGEFAERIQSIIISTTKDELKDGALRSIISNELERIILVDAEKRAASPTVSTEEEFKD